jgi:hypothetical protein
VTEWQLRQGDRETQSRGVYASYLTDKSCYNVIGAARVGKVKFALAVSSGNAQLPP